MNKIFSLFISFVFLSVLCFAQESTDTKDTATEAVAEAEQTKDSEPKEGKRVQFMPVKKRDPFLSRDEVATIERNLRDKMDRIAKEKKAKEDALIAARDAEKAKAEREAYLKANPHLAIVGKIKIQGMMGDEVQINNDFKGVGDKVAGGAVITRITGTRIYFKYKGKDFSLPIPKPKE